MLWWFISFWHFGWMCFFFFRALLVTKADKVLREETEQRYISITYLNSSKKKMFGDFPWHTTEGGLKCL